MGASAAEDDEASGVDPDHSAPGDPGDRTGPVVDEVPQAEHPSFTGPAAWPAATVEHFKKLGYTTRTGPGASLSAIERDAAGAVRSAAR